MSQLVVALLLVGIEQRGLDVLTLVEGLPREELLRSRLTRRAVLGNLQAMAGSAQQLDLDTRQTVAEIDWPAWDGLNTMLWGPAGEPLDEALVFASESLVPATLLWLRVYRKSHPMLFNVAP